MSPHPLTNFKIQKYCQNETKFNGAYSGNNLSKKNDGTCIINLDEYESIETHSIALYVNVTYFDSFEVEYIQKKITKFIGNKNIITNIYRMQAYDSITCEYFSIGFIDFILKGKSRIYFLLMNIKRMIT